MWVTDAPRSWPWRRALLPLLLAVAAAPAWTGDTANEADIERARRQQPQVTERDIELARRHHRAPSDAELRQLPLPAPPSIDALPAPATRGPVDLGAVARGFEALTPPPALAAAAPPRLLVFISLSMPEPTLVRLVDQAARARAVLVLRGLAEGSLARTVLRVRQLVGTRRVAVQIDPQAFDRYAVAAVPAFVLVRGGSASPDCTGNLCASSDAFVKAAGDVSLDHALEQFRQRAPAFGANASQFLARLGSKP